VSKKRQKAKAPGGGNLGLGVAGLKERCVRGIRSRPFDEETLGAWAAEDCDGRHTSVGCPDKEASILLSFRPRISVRDRLQPRLHRTPLGVQ